MDGLEQIAREAAGRAERQYTEAMSALSETDRQVIATHIAFALLHARMRRFAGATRMGMRPVAQRTTTIRSSRAPVARYHWPTIVL